MSDVANRPVMSQKPFAAIVAALALTVLAIGGMRLAGLEATSSLPSQAVEGTRLLKFEDAPLGSVIVRDSISGVIIQSFGVGEGAFVRATLRALVNDRRRKGTTEKGDFRLERRTGSQLYLIDEATGKQLALNAYGPGNAAVFAAFMSNQRKGEGQ
jgi:putative photosynthetic complex assembly protein